MLAPYGTFEEHGARRLRRFRLAVLPLLALAAVALILVAASDERVQQSFNELVESAEKVAESNSLQKLQLKEARQDQTRAKELASLLAAANSELQSDEQTANQLAASAQQQAGVVNSLRQKMDLASPQGINAANDNLSNQEAKDAAQQNALLQQEAALKQQEQQLLLGESEESNMAAASEEQAHQSDLGETKDEGLIQSENAAITDDKNAIVGLFAKERPLMMQVQSLQNLVNTARVEMQNAMSTMDQYKEAGQAKVLEAQMNARSKRRHDRDNAERALNRAVAKEQQLQNGPDHRRLKLKGAAAAQLTRAQEAVKKAQAALSAAYSETYVPAPAAASPPSAAQLAAQSAEDAATAKVERLMTELHATKRQLGMLEAQVSNYQNRQMSNERLLQMIENRAQNEEGEIALLTGRAASARQLASQDAKQVNSLEAMAQNVQNKIQLFSNMRNKDMGQLTAQAMNKKKLLAKLTAATNSAKVASGELSIEQARASQAFAKVAAQAKQIAVLKAEQRQDISQAAQLLSEAHLQESFAGQQQLNAGDAPEPLPPAPYPTISPPAATAQ